MWLQLGRNLKAMNCSLSGFQLASVPSGMLARCTRAAWLCTFLPRHPFETYRIGGRKRLRILPAR
jgi:hypothetical protein